MKILLLNPPRDHEVVGNNPSIIEEERGLNPPLGLLYLAGYLKDRTTHQVVILDAQAERLDTDAIRERLERESPDWVGITAMTLTLLDVVACIEAVRKGAPAARIVLGGPHVHLYPDETARLPGVDVLVLGEGERTLAALLDAGTERAAWRRIPGLVYAQDGEVIHTGAPAIIEDLDDLPFPARDETRIERYSSLLSSHAMATTLFTSRGCPYGCRFCDRPHLGKRFRARSPANVVAEIRACVEMGIRSFLVYDDTFTVRRDRAMEICQRLIDDVPGIEFDIRARVDTVDGELLRLLKRAGCRGVHYGVEAGTPHIIERLNKGITIPQVAETFALTRKIGIPVLAYFMIGNPGETRADILETFRVMRELNPDYVHLTILTPFPGTEVYAEAMECGVIQTDVWRSFAADPRSDFVPLVWEEHLSREELQSLLVQGYRGFYLRPRYILKRLWALRSWPEFRRKVAAGMGVFRMKG